MTSAVIIEIAYLLAAVLFILGLKAMSHPATAVRGNLLGAVGMGIAIAAALFNPQAEGFWLTGVGLVVGTVAGLALAMTVPLTSMPQMVALLNGLGGGASVLVGGAELVLGESHAIDTLLAVAASGVIGGVTFWGSLVAYAKLEEWNAFKKPLSFPGQQLLNIALLVGCLLAGLALATFADSDKPEAEKTSAFVFLALYAVIVFASSVLGFTLTLPIGGADMPVVIALLNSYSGLAAAATGFVIDNNVLIISGSLVGASGVILTQIMCQAMNRSIWNVLVGGQEVGETKADDAVYHGVRRTDPESVAVLLAAAQRVAIVPGYGMAVAQCQHAVKELVRLMEARGTTVEFAIHPVAGRMPGHMNVLLAEADIPYEQMKEMDEINPTFGQVDVAIVIGANDVVNPTARTDPTSPIAGMPILDVDKAANVIVIKRSLSPGFAGIPNPLFALPNTLMLFADAKQGVLDLVTALKQV
jgi:NAD(P) transhydrogenase subunit beta